MRDHIGKILLLIVAFLMCLVIYLSLDTVAKEQKKVQNDQVKEIQHEMFKLGASMYRSQVVGLYGDSAAATVDSLFLLEVYDFNDSLGIVIQKSMKEDFQ